MKVNETFVYHCLAEKIETVPMFAVYGDEELDFAIYLKGLTEGGSYNKIYTIPIYLFP